MSIAILPNDVRLMIIEYLSIDDCFALFQLYPGYFDKTNNSVWAHKLFEKHIQNPEKSLNILKYSYLETSFYQPTSSELQNFANAQNLWRNLMDSQSQLNNLLQTTFHCDIDQAKSFSDRMLSVLADPPLPMLSLKRSYQYVETSSKFENFLTELHFGVYPKAASHDRDLLMIKDVCEEIHKAKDQIEVSSRTSIKNRAARSLKMKKTKIISRLSIGSKSGEAQQPATHKKTVNEVYKTMIKLVKNHCRIIRGYLQSLDDKKILLKEYQRCWKEFTYSIIEINGLMEPYEELIKLNRDDVEKSMWRGMVTVWTDCVYKKLAAKIKSSFQKLFKETFKPKVLDQLMSAKQSREQSACGKDKDQRVYFNIQSVDDDNIVQEKSIKLLRKTFIAISDISLCKNNITDSEAEKLINLQPKMKLINDLYPNIKGFIEEGAKALGEKSYEFETLMKEVQEVFSIIFNGEIDIEEVTADNSVEEKEDEYSFTESVTESIESQEWDGFEDADDGSRFSEILGQYRLVEKCKWDHRLGYLYQDNKDSFDFTGIY